LFLGILGFYNVRGQLTVLINQRLHGFNHRIGSKGSKAILIIRVPLLVGI
jgi:hypothetical protein